ncbi:MAG: hypothetical protein HYR81_02670 [Nitrospirae bacterium]|nr:hypothetical protein [Nitrospirota bacterium]MBI3589274.1 hypothetical protein [Candidatus Liptonbacteria bacterium]
MDDLNEEKNLEIPAASWGSTVVAVIAVIAFFLLLVYHVGSQKNNQLSSVNKVDSSHHSAAEKETIATPSESVLPSAGVELPIGWGDLGKQMVQLGVIDQGPFEQIYAGRGGLRAEEKSLLLDSKNDRVVMTMQNSGYLLNLFWAFGLANQNPILEKGPMKDSRYGGAGNFASTGGWTLAKGNAMDHYSKHELVKLTPEQQLLVEKVSKNIYRPCCGNSTYFPDCNHGMAMLGLLELMAANGANENEMYKVALQVNSYWFPDTYLTIDKYLKMKGTSLEKADPKEILGADYSSAYGYANILSQVQTPEKKSSGGGCGV